MNYQKNKKKIFIIAEAGVNHNGKINLAKKLVSKAKWAGADAVKFQTYDYKLNYNVKYTNPKTISWAKKLTLSEKNLIKLKKYCEKKKIEFMSTAFDIKSADFLNKIGMKKFKISSSGIFNIPLVKFISKLEKPIFLSTGMCKINDIQFSIKNLKKKKLCLLYCVSLYPSKYSDFDLTKITSLRKAFDVPVGFSDHSPGIDLAIASVGFGAKVIEKHIMLDKKIIYPDSKVSIIPKEFKKMVCSIRNLEKSIGDGKLKIMKKELSSRKKLTHGFYYNNNFKKGHILKKKDVILLKPSGKIPIENYHKLLNSVLLRNVNKMNEILPKEIRFKSAK
tara:strand:+ start:3208 stop:4209 length:1002 start_codon:yes stop_codon:yes gene_type:complete